VMIMHFLHFYCKHGPHHRYIAVMISAMVRSRLARNSTEAIPKLSVWSEIISEDFKERNLSASNGGLVGGATFQNQVHKLNQEVACLIEAKAEMQAQLQQLVNATTTTVWELRVVKDRLQQVLEQNSQLLEDNQTLIQQNHMILQLLDGNQSMPRGQQITPSPPTAPPPGNRPHAATPPENRNTPQLPPAASRTGPSTPAEGPPAPAPRTVQQALQGFRDDVDTGKKDRQGQVKHSLAFLQLGGKILNNNVLNPFGQLGQIWIARLLGFITGCLEREIKQGHKSKKFYGCLMLHGQQKKELT
jgi:hypothetical protein